MDELQIIGYLAAILTGFVLGAVGSGGSILAMPVLTTVFMVPTTEATSYSLFIVGMTALTGTIRGHRKSELSWPTALKFGAPMMLAVFVSRFWILPSIPDEWFGVSRDRTLILLFAIVMLGAARAMWKGRGKVKSGNRPSWVVIIQGFATGILTGLVGAGGGFIIVPALVLGLKLPMRLATGTSLAIIAVNSAFGFSTDLIKGFVDIDWELLLPFAGLSIIGLFVGAPLASRLPQQTVKKGFSIFIVLIATYLIIKG